MAKLTINDAENTATRIRPWTFRMESPTGDYWYATGRGLTEAVEIGWGAAGAGTQYQLTDWVGLRTMVADTLNQGYFYVDTPYVRMTPVSLAKVMAPVTTMVPAPIVAPVIVPSVRIPVVPVVAPVTLTVGKAHHLKILRTGAAITGYSVVDDKGNEIQRLDPKDGPQFARDHNVDIEF